MRFGWKFGLGPMRRALARLGQPERSFPAVVVAGSKGKGSTAALLEALLLAAGHRPGSTPRRTWSRIRERIRLDGAQIVGGRSGGASATLRARLGPRARLTHFEWLTLAALEYFARRGPPRRCSRSASAGASTR